MEANVSLNASGSNSTERGSTAADLGVINILTYVFLCAVTFGIGASVNIGDLKVVWRKRKVSFFIGLVSQYLVMPAAARLVSTVILRMPSRDAFAVILIGCCPGGATSNAFAYFAKADMGLSVSMTAVSNALAFGTLPLLLFIWTRGMDGGSDSAGVTAEDPRIESISIPFLDILASLCMVLVPAALGGALRHYNLKWGRRAEKFGALCGAVLISASVCVGMIQNGSVINNAQLFPWKNGVAVVLVAPIGMAFALLAAQLVRHSPARCCPRICGDQPASQLLPLPSVATVVMETGIQNTVIALAILTMASSDWDADASFRLQLIAIVWGIFVSSEATFAMLAFRYLIVREERRAAAVAAADKPSVEVL